MTSDGTEAQPHQPNVQHIPVDALMTMTAVAVASRFDAAKAATQLGTESRKVGGGVLVDSGFYIFHFGAVVLVDVPEIDAALTTKLEAATGSTLLPDTADTWEVASGAELHQDHPRVGWDRVVVAEAAPELLDTVALLLGQSVALERYETDADQLLDTGLEIARRLASTGKPPRFTKTTVRQLGRLTADRLEMARWLNVTDRPAASWEDRRVSTLYDGLYEGLELRERHDALVHKLEAVESAASTVVEIGMGNHSAMLEWAIIILIAVEIVLALAGAF